MGYSERQIVLGFGYRLTGDELMDELRYEIDLFWSEEDQAYIAEAPELAGCMADGPT
jgi:predicted RNase H-like HicB family nuclease